MHILKMLFSQASTGSSPSSSSSSFLKTLQIGTLCCIVVSLTFIGYCRNLRKSLPIKFVQNLEFLHRLNGPLESDDKRVINYIISDVLRPPLYGENSTSVKLNVGYMTDRIWVPHWEFHFNILHKMFRDEPPGFFVEARAVDGEYLSNFLWLEKEKNWTGLLIEPDFQNYNYMLKKNRNAWIAQSCISPSAFPKRITFGRPNPFTGDPETEKTLSLAYGSINFDVRHGYEMGDIYNRVFANVQCFPLQSFLFALNVTVVDFLSLDIQGGEWEVVKHFPWDRIKIKAMDIEYVGPSGNLSVIHQPFIDYVESINFKLIALSNQSDYVFISREERSLLAKFPYLIHEKPKGTKG